MKNLYKIENEVYIVSNTENVNENCWIIVDDRLVQVSYLLSDEVARGNKVILTTNKLLIKDGVQAIPDEFLEWFVKNPSCEFVETLFHYPTIDDEGGYSLNLGYWTIDIPKGEPKQCDICNMFPILEGTNKCESCYSVIRHFLEQAPELKEHLLPELRKKQETSSVGAENQIFKIVLDEKWRPNKVSMIETDNNSVLKKQETLEEAAINHCKLIEDFPALENPIFSFREGAKWQQERSYSEEEVGELLYNVIGEYGKHYGIMIDGKMLNDLFEQFKKK